MNPPPESNVITGLDLKVVEEERKRQEEFETKKKEAEELERKKQEEAELIRKTF